MAGGYLSDAHRQWDDRLCNALLGWEAFEKGARVNLINLIGYKAATTFGSRAEIRAELVRIRDGLNAAGALSTVGRVHGFITYIDRLENPKAMSIKQYFENMTGMALQPFPREKVVSVASDLMVYMKALKPGFDFADFKDIPKILAGLDTKLDAKTFDARMKAQFELDKAELARLTGLDTNIKISTHYSDVGENAEACCEWGKGEIRVLFNTRYNTFRFYQQLNAMRHETFGHGLSWTLIAKEIAAGRLPKSMGIQTAFGRELVHGEAVSEVVSKLLTRTVGNENLNHAHNLHLTHIRMVCHNAYIICMDEGAEKAKEYIKTMAPYADPERAVKDIELRLANPERVHYSLLYAPVNAALSSAISAINPHNFGAIMREISPVLLDARGLNMRLEAHTRSKRHSIPLAKNV